MLKSLSGVKAFEFRFAPDVGVAADLRLKTEDLFYRVNVIGVHLPPLRERPEDIAPLADHFLGKFAAHMEKPVRTISREAHERLNAYRWPGNIRELRNVLERAALLSDSNVIERRDLRLDTGLTASNGNVDLNLTLAEVERRHIERVLATENGHVERAALRLGVPRSTLYYKIKSLGIAPAKV